MHLALMWVVIIRHIRSQIPALETLVSKILGSKIQNLNEKYESTITEWSYKNLGERDHRRYRFLTPYKNCIFSVSLSPQTGMDFLQKTKLQLSHFIKSHWSLSAILSKWFCRLKTLTNKRVNCMWFCFAFWCTWSFNSIISGA